MRKSIIALAAVLVPLVAMFFAVDLNVKLTGTPEWVRDVWFAGGIYWVVALVALIRFVIKRERPIAMGLGIGVGIGFFIVIAATGLQI